MFFSEETFRAVLVAALAQNTTQHASEVITEMVDALIDADRKLRAYDKECWGSTSEVR